MIVLGIETSCDETAIAVLKVEHRQGATCPRFQVLSNIISSQVSIHAQYGGVVPEVAARKHAENFMDILQTALKRANKKKEDIDILACTFAPGLITSLMVGVAAGKTLSFALKKPLVPVHHIKAHIYANFIERPIFLQREKNKSIAFKHLFPALCLVVSGGHTELILMRGFEHFTKIGQTLDDAAGEAFDKVAKLLQLSYPGGPSIAKLALKGDKTKYAFPRPMLNQDNLHFSFAGLKTSVLYLLRALKVTGRNLSNKMKADICASFQQAVVDCLVQKTLRAAEQYSVKTVMLGGGVAANLELRTQLKEGLKKKLPDIQFHKPPLEYCTDNAVMIATAGYYRYMTAANKSPRRQAGKKFLLTWKNLRAEPNLEIQETCPLFL